MKIKKKNLQNAKHEASGFLSYVAMSNKFQNTRNVNETKISSLVLFTIKTYRKSVLDIIEHKLHVHVHV